MPLDPSIPLSYRMPQFDTPMELMARRASIASIGRRGVLEAQAIRENEMQYNQQLEKVDRASRVRDAMMNAPDARTAIAAVRRIDPYAAAELEKNVLAREKEDRTAAEEAYKLGKMVQEDVGTELVSLLDIKDDNELPKAYETAVAGLLAKPFYRDHPVGQRIKAEIPAQLPAGGRKWLEQHARAIVPALMKQRDDAALKAQESAALVAGRTADTRAKTLASVGQVLGAATNQDQWDAGLKGQPEDIQATFGLTFTPEGAKRALDLGKTPEQRAAAEERTAQRARQEEADADLAEHRRALEAAARDRNERTRTKQGQKDQTSRLDRLQREVDSVDAQEQKWHAERQRLGDILAAKQGDEVIWRSRVQAMNATLRGEVEREFKRATDETTRLFGLKQRKLGEMGKTPEAVPSGPLSAIGTTAPPAAPAPAVAARPAAPAAGGQPPPSAPAPAETYTEAEVRRRARARGVDENAAVAAAKQRGLIR